MSSTGLFTKIDETYSYTIEDPLAVAQKWAGVRARYRFDDDDGDQEDTLRHFKIRLPALRPVVTRIEFVRAYDHQHREIGRGAWMLGHNGAPWVYAKDALIGLDGKGILSTLTKELMSELDIREDIFPRINDLVSNTGQQYALALDINK